MHFHSNVDNFFIILKTVLGNLTNIQINKLALGIKGFTSVSLVLKQADCMLIACKFNLNN